MTVRLLNAEDYAQYLELINLFRHTQFTEEQFRAIVATHQRTGTEVWVYEVNGSLLATGTILYEQKFIHDLATYAHIEDVCVRPSHRGLGLGKRLIKRLMDQASNCHKINLNCADSLIPLYESCGFERKGNQMSHAVQKK